MSRNLQVVTPMERLYVRDEVEIALISIEVWASGVIVRLAGLPSEQSERLERSYSRALEEWGRARREGRTREDHPREQPAERLFDVDLTLRDDLGTSYALRVRSAGGSGWLLRADWSFEPGPPDSTSALSVGVEGEGIESTSVRVPI